jgi:hypothetical protein
VSSKTASKDLKDLEKDLSGLVSFKFVSSLSKQQGGLQDKNQDQPKIKVTVTKETINTSALIKDTSLVTTAISTTVATPQHQTRPDNLSPNQAGYRLL